MIDLNQTINGDWITELQKLPEESIDCCITSPPYWKLRDYDMEGQVGLENSYLDYIKTLVNGFKEVKRVLKKEGTLWVNIGDSYASAKKSRGKEAAEGKATLRGRQSGGMKVQESKIVEDLKEKDLVGIPWQLAFALRKDGWYLRQDIIWHKTNGMPESVNDRCSKSHEYIFLLSKSPSYYFDREAIKIPAADSTIRRLKQDIPNQKGSSRGNNGARAQDRPMKSVGGSMVNKKSVWPQSTKGIKENHFASFPQELAADMVRAGCPIGGTVLDPFHGSGTTGIVCTKLNRNYLAIELNPKYIEIEVVRRSENLGMFK